MEIKSFNAQIVGLSDVVKVAGPQILDAVEYLYGWTPDNSGLSFALAELDSIIFQLEDDAQKAVLDAVAKGLGVEKISRGNVENLFVDLTA